MHHLTSKCFEIRTKKLNCAYLFNHENMPGNYNDFCESQNDERLEKFKSRISFKRRYYSNTAVRKKKLSKEVIYINRNDDTVCTLYYLVADAFYC